MDSKELCSICYAMSARPIVNEDSSGALDKPWKSNHHTMRDPEKLIAVYAAYFGMVSVGKNELMSSSETMQLKDWGDPRGRSGLNHLPTLIDAMMEGPQFWDPVEGLARRLNFCSIPP
jgi:hypothetical protein